MPTINTVAALHHYIRTSKTHINMFQLTPETRELLGKQDTYTAETLPRDLQIAVAEIQAQKKRMQTKNLRSGPLSLGIPLISRNNALAVALSERKVAKEKREESRIANRLEGFQVRANFDLYLIGPTETGIPPQENRSDKEKSLIARATIEATLAPSNSSGRQIRDAIFMTEDEIRAFPNLVEALNRDPTKISVVMENFFGKVLYTRLENGSDQTVVQNSRDLNHILTTVGLVTSRIQDHGH